MTVLDLLTRAAQELNLFDAGTALEANDAAFIFDLANDFLDGLKTQGLSVSQVTRQTFVISAGVQSYAVGIGATVNLDRPVNPDAIVNIGYLDTATTPNTEILTGGPIDLATYTAIPQKTLAGTYPARWYYDPTTPTGTLKPYPVPNIPLTGVIYGPTLLAEFTSLSQTLTLVPGTRRFLRTAIALEIADAYEKTPSQELKEKAREARADFKRANQRIEDMVLWPSGQYDIYSDTYLR